MIGKRRQSRRVTGWRPPLLTLLAALTLAGCTGSTPTAPDQPYNEHEWVEVHRLLSGVRGVVLAMPGHLRIDQGPSEGLSMRGEMILLPAVTTQVRSGILEIAFEADYLPHPGRPTEFVLSAPALESAELNAHGAIECWSFEGARLALRMMDAGDLDLQRLSVEELRVTAAPGAGAMRVDGDAARQYLELAATADYEGRDLQSSEAHVTLSGSGSATVRVRDHLTAVVGGSGSVYYFGDPEVESTISGSGRVVRLGG